MRDEVGLRRQWALILALTSSRAGLTIGELAAVAGVTSRTIRRDLEAFRGVGFPLREVVGDGGKKAWSIRPGRDHPGLAFTYDEAMALELGRRMLEPLENTAFGEASESARLKIRAVLGSGAVEYIRRCSALLHVTSIHPAGRGARAELVDAIRSAYEDGNEATLTYRSDGAERATARVVHPRGMFSHRGALYMVADDPTAGKPKHYKVDRIEGFEPGGPAPPTPGGFDVKAHMTLAFAAYLVDGDPAEVRVRFVPSAARYVRETRWHASQTLTRLPDGSVEARFLVSGTEEIKRWILGFGSKAVVLEPASLRREIQAELRELIAAYEEPAVAEGPADGRQDPPRAARPGRRAGRATTRRS